MKPTSEKNGQLSLTIIEQGKQSNVLVCPELSKNSPSPAKHTMDPMLWRGREHAAYTNRG